MQPCSLVDMRWDVKNAALDRRPEQVVWERDLVVL